MSVGFGFSIGDILAAGELAQKIYVNCFTEAQAAHVKYAQFRQDINGLATGLKQLEDIVQRAQTLSTQAVQAPWRAGVQPASVVLDTLPQLTGDFHATLRECEKLLLIHAKIQAGSSSVTQNFAFWAGGASRDIEGLRTRVQLHITKIALVSKPFEEQLLLEIRLEVGRLRDDVARLAGVVTSGAGDQQPEYLHDLEIPDDIASRFEAALQTNAPTSFVQTGQIPIKEGFDALVFNFAKSTVEFNAVPRLGQTAPEASQYLNLLKSAWIMRLLKSSSDYKALSSDSLWSECLRELEDDMRGQMRRFESGSMTKPAYESFSHLPDANFSLWVEEKSLSQPPVLAATAALEDKILELPIILDPHLTNRTSTLTVLRRSEVEYRLVTTTKQHDNPHFHSEESIPVNVGSSKIIPAYATNVENFEAPSNIVVCNDQGLFPSWYTLKDRCEAEVMQQALTNYRVHCSIPAISFWLDNVEMGTGSLQLWQYKPLRAALPGSPASNSQEITSFGSASPPEPISQFTPPSPTPVAERTFTGSKTTLVASSQSLGRTTSPTYSSNAPRLDSDARSKAFSGKTFLSTHSFASRVAGPQHSGVELIQPESPALLIFTKLRDCLAYIYLPLTNNIFVNPKACSCRNPLKSCKRVVLESKERKFKVRKLVATQRDGSKEDLFSWDISTFRTPRPAKFDDLKVIEKVKTLTLSLGSVQAKDVFLDELGALEDWRTHELNEYESARREARKQGIKKSAGT